MYIERVQVEGGFLHGLDLQLHPSLNVLIGARGTGKTSLIELIRFGLAAPTFTQAAQTEAAEMARAILGGGRVTIGLRDENEQIVVTRSADEADPVSSDSFGLPTVLGQKEVEAVGLQLSGRRRLIDRLFPGATAIGASARDIRAELRSLTVEIAALGGEQDAIRSQIAELESVPGELDLANREQTALLRTLAVSREDQEELSALQHQISLLATRTTAISEARQAIQRYGDSVDSLIALQPPSIQWPDDADQPPEILRAQELLGESANSLTRAREHLAATDQELSTLENSILVKRTEAEDRGRTIRSRLDELQSGAAEMARRVEVLEARSGQLNALRQSLAERSERVASASGQRESRYEMLDDLRESRFTERTAVAVRLNDALAPSVRVTVTKSADTSAYTNAIKNALRGSGLHYNTLAPQLAQRVSPLELVALSESSSMQRLARAAEIPEDRAAAAIAYLRNSDLSPVVTAAIDDGASFELLDGADYKATPMMSIGQRCTVVMPILLSAHPQMLVIDQPEDHLDNAFITGTLVESLRARAQGDQLIFASHNANIPVLGEADLVVRLDSDGRRGFVRTAGPLSAPPIVEAITSVMEGGIEAFRRRAEFYEAALDS